MADTVAITAGAGTTIATDDAGAGGHAQVIKLAISANGDITFIPADAANGLDVDVTRLPALVAGSAAIGKLAANSGVDIGDVDVTSLPAIPTGANTIGAVEQVRPATSAVTSVNDTASSTQLLASTAGRKAGYFYNDSTSVMYLKLGTTASATDYTVQLGPGAFWDLPVPCYTGRVDAIWSADASGAVKITELT